MGAISEQFQFVASKRYLGFLVLLTACDQVRPIDIVDEACVPPAVQTALDSACARSGCHDVVGAAAGLVLSAPHSAGILSADSSQRSLPLVELGDTRSSYLAHKIMAIPPEPIVGLQMPVGAAPETVEAVATILGWVAGAPLEGCGDDAQPPDEQPPGDVAHGHDLPCEIDDLLQRRCRSCHSNPPLAAPVPLVSRDDLLAAAPSDPQLTLAESAALRLADPAAPMPPSPATRASSEELDAFIRWVDEGAPAGTCDEPSDPDPFAVDPRCSSGVYWDREDDGDPRMLPGRDCIGCHDTERNLDPDDDDIPDLVVGGTVFPTAYEPDRCYGDSSPDLRIIVRSIDADAEVSLTPGPSGNFLLNRAAAPPDFAPPYEVKLIDGDRERIMPIPATSGSCNTCHTQDGANGAPGRVVSP